MDTTPAPQIDVDPSNPPGGYYVEDVWNAQTDPPLVGVAAPPSPPEDPADLPDDPDA